MGLDRIPECGVKLFENNRSQWAVRSPAGSLNSPVSGIAQDFDSRPQFTASPSKPKGPAKQLKQVPPPGATFAS